MAGIISGFLDGAGRAAATSGRMFLADQIAQEREEANYLRDKELKKSSQSFTTSERVAGQEFTASENEKKRQSRESIADTKAKNKKSDGLTNQAKNIQFLMSAEGGNKPLNEAVILAFPGSKIKHTDEEGNQIVVVPAGKNKFTEVGRIVTDEKGKQQWLNKGEQLENAEITSKHRKSAKEKASGKAGFLRSDKEDFPSTGGDRKEFTKNEAQRLANEERAAKKGGGIIGSAMKSPSDMMLPGGESVQDTKKIQGKSISKEQYIKSMVSKYGESNRAAIEKKWNSY